LDKSHVFLSKDTVKHEIIDLSNAEAPLINYKIKWGLASTEIEFKDKDTEILEDAMFAEDLTYNGNEGLFYVHAINGSGKIAFIKYNLSQIPSDSEIENVSLCFHRISLDYSEDLDLWFASNKTWKEEDIDDMCDHGDYCEEIAEANFFTEKIYTQNGFSSSFRHCFNHADLTTKVNNEYTNINVSFVINNTGNPADPYGWASKDYTGDVKYLPFMNITYFESNDSNESQEKTLISMVTGTTPFYTNGSNPTTINIGNNECQTINWWVNSTGLLNSTHQFFAYANLTSDMTINSESEKYNLTIIQSGSLSSSLYIDLQYPTQDINVNQNSFFNVTNKVCCYDDDCGNVNVSLDPEQISYTPSSKTVCTSSTCIKKIFGGTRFVFEDNQWKNIENARSLKGVFDIIIDEDPHFPVEIIDFNLTSIILDISVSKDYNNDKIDFKIYDKFDQFKQLRDKQGSIINLNKRIKLKNNKKQRVMFDFSEINDTILSLEFKWGKNSTTIIFNSSDGSFLEDAMFDEDTTRSGSNGIIYSEYCDGDGEVSFYKFDLSSIPSGSTIDNASICLFKISGDSSGPVDFWYSDNLTWKEEDIDDLCGDGDFCNDVNDFMDEFIYTAQTGSQMNCFNNVNLTTKFDSKYSNDNFTVVLNVTNFGSDYGWPTKEYGGPASYLPYVEITYSSANQSPYNKNNSLVSTTTGDIPFYTNSSNPTTVNLNIHDCTEVTWWVNATGDTDSTHLFYSFANLTSDMSINANTIEIDISISDEN
jgi:hypothetical protein